MARIYVFRGTDFDSFIWNIDANVGLRSPNRKLDVELVQFGYFALSVGPKSNPTLKPIAARVMPGAPYSGDPNDPLSLAIIAHQKSRGGTQDGHVSPIHGATDRYQAADGPHGFLMGSLVNNMFDLMPDDFPRIDKHPKCPPELKKAIAQSFAR